MPGPRVYPEAPNGPLELPAAVGTPAPTFTPIEQLAGSDRSTPRIPRTMFIRVAMSGANCTGVNSATAPNFYVRADSGDAVLINDHAQPPNQTYPIFHRPGSNPVDFVGEGSVFLEGHNVFRLVITFDDGVGDHAWQLGIWSNDAAAARQFTWVVAGTLADTAQPWIDVTPALLSFDAAAGTALVRSFKISNRGTRAFTVTGVTSPAEFSFGALPAVIDPNTSAEPFVAFNAPAAPPPGGVISGLVSINITPPDINAGAAAGHRRQFSASGHASLNSWERKSPMPTPRNSLALAAAGNGKLYALGGSGPPAGTFNPVATLEEYDPATDSWATKAPMSIARSDLGLAAAPNGKLYAVGGMTSGLNILATLEEYDLATNTWTTKTPMPTARWGLGFAAASNGKLYAVGGSVPPGGTILAVTTVEEYDPATDRWTTKAPMPTPRPELALAAASNGRLYAVGGIRLVQGDDDDDGTHTHAMAMMEEYDPASDSWATKLPMPTARETPGLAGARNGKLYAVGGGDNPAVFSVVEEYDPLSNSWTTKAPMPTPRTSLGLACATNGKIYAVGGAGGILSIVEEYTT